MIGPRLKDLGRWFSGGTPPSQEWELWEGRVPWLSGKDFAKTTLRSPTKFITEDAAKTYSRQMPGGRSLLLLVRGMALAHGLPIAQLSFDAAINQDVRGLAVAPEFDPRFVYYALLGRRNELDSHIDRAAHGTARLRETVYAHRLSWFPDRAAQQRIGEFLDRECERIASAHRAAEATRAATVQAWGEFLGDAIRDAPRVVIKRLGVDVTQGWSPQAEDREAENGEPAILKLSAVSGGLFDPSLSKALPNASSEEIRRYSVHSGDLLMVRASGSLSLLGRACLVDSEPVSPLLYPDIVYRLHCSDSRLPGPLLLEILGSPQGRDALEMLKRGAANNKIRIEDVRNLTLPVPEPSRVDGLLRTARTRRNALTIVREEGAKLTMSLIAYRDSLIHEAAGGILDVGRLSESQMEEHLHAAQDGSLDEVVA